MIVGGNIDHVTRTMMTAIALETIAQSRGIKVIAVTHDVGPARRLAQETVFLHHGKLIEHQPASRFFRSSKSDVARAFV
jgi:tungstate transport system ATP-binding protein